MLIQFITILRDFVVDITDEPLDTETFNVEFPSLAEEGGFQVRNPVGDIIEAPMRQREPVDTDDYFDAEEDLGGDLMETSFPSLSHEVVSILYSKQPKALFSRFITCLFDVNK